MRVRSIGHASLEIEAAGLRLLTNPWWEGAAHAGQWQQWPAPQPGGVESRHIDYLYLSSNDDDHFHLPTLRTLRPGTTLLVPESLSRRLPRGLRDELGLSRVVELRHGRTVQLRRGLRVTSYVNLDRSILVLEDGNHVMVDADSALHGAPAVVIDYFCRLLRLRHPSVDTLFLGHRSASWFPNCFRLPGKDDRAVARGREELHLDNFLRVVDQIRPRLACAFGGSFVLVEPQNRWINAVRFDLPSPDLECERRGIAAGTRCHVLLPNDVVDGTEIVKGTTLRPSLEELEKAYATTLRQSCEHASQLQPLSPDQLRDLVIRLDARVKAYRPRLGNVRPFVMELRLRENPGTALRLEVDDLHARAALGPARGPSAWMDMRAEVLDAILRDPNRIDAITSGYGAVASIGCPEHVVYVNAALMLLGAQATGLRGALEGLRRRPITMLGTLWRQRWPVALHIGARLGLLSHPFELRPLDAPMPGTREAA